ncbi:hypothetical protein EHI8A_135720 [Entamoeba histolytica HM-1:IMSS-B]|uniref:Ras guanine nucleotide exchange factor n=6 Tax=Entamoeba histolytica TaxID=5759 RepID=C4M4S9_ENTH1|nr:hypothetical protein EHI_095170 [Entamoeba histolytica HM-1:IMSS]EMD45129.1 Hypothetical protein EHI5A_171190 [Entamoeba histolytica KU27]EMH77395.1 hypothetical protein EHI8A_135720 [Entamoeba histolytica HM-1:IMSS-B]EMS13304.1 hypothetical protein KM1_089320 [Entamoeba histolytica HM-3:IMSS]ENY62499.1 hypothetical protein EHI7A_126430 [Entamoeba histolytica HM-1:IMSS-A]GAT96386.1 hypothetical protein CL6EHI_095170 [Entamoeba histolytica]|eukprot:XP_648639.1 hypothetical protein EHI_095170 [Entamoeba histolytica HM-1:IMSS]
MEDLPDIEYKHFPIINLNDFYSSSGSGEEQTSSTEELDDDEIDLEEMNRTFSRLSLQGTTEFNNEIDKQPSLLKIKKMSSALQIGNEIIESQQKQIETTPNSTIEKSYEKVEDVNSQINIINEEGIKEEKENDECLNNVRYSFNSFGSVATIESNENVDNIIDIIDTANEPKFSMDDFVKNPLSTEDIVSELSQWHGEEDHFYSTISDLNSIYFSSFVVHYLGALKPLLDFTPRTTISNSIKNSLQRISARITSSPRSNSPPSSEPTEEYCIRLLQNIKDIQQQEILDNLISLNKGKELLDFASNNQMKEIPSSPSDCVLMLLFVINEYNMGFFTPTLPSKPDYNTLQMNDLRVMIHSLSKKQKIIIEGILDLTNVPYIQILALFGLFNSGQSAMERTNAIPQAYCMYEVLMNRRIYLMEGVVNGISIANKEINLCTLQALINKMSVLDDKMLTIICQVHSLFCDSEEFIEKLRTRCFYHSIEIYRSVFKDIDKEIDTPLPITVESLCNILLPYLDSPKILAQAITTVFSNALCLINPIDFVVEESKGTMFYIQTVDLFQQTLCHILQTKPSSIKQVIALGKELKDINNFEGAGAVGLAISCRCSDVELKKLKSKYKHIITSLATMFKARTNIYTKILNAASFPKIPVYAFSKNVVEMSKVKPTFCEFYPDYIDFGGKCLPIGNICYLYKCCQMNPYQIKLNDDILQNIVDKWLGFH